jgi:hypothetical protein
MKTILLTSLLALIFFTAFSQKNMDDVIYLKNGSKIKGSIVQLFPDSIVQIKQLDGSMWFFLMKDVSLIAKEEKMKSQDLISDGKGFQLGAEAGFLLGSGGAEKKAPFGVHAIGSYRIFPNLALGVGTGLEFLNHTQLPLYIDTRFYVNKKFYSPYLFFQAGATLPLDKEFDIEWSTSYEAKPGYMINPGIGILFPMSEKTAFSISFSYRYNELSYKRTKPNLVDYTRIEQMNRFNLKFGFLIR